MPYYRVKTLEICPKIIRDSGGIRPMIKSKLFHSLAGWPVFLTLYLGHLKNQESSIYLMGCNEYNLSPCIQFLEWCLIYACEVLLVLINHSDFRQHPHALFSGSNERS